MTSTAHIITAQETKLGVGQIAAASRWALSKGWKMLAAPAIAGRKGGRSAGVAVFVRKQLGLRFPPRET